MKRTNYRKHAEAVEAMRSGKARGYTTATPQERRKAARDSLPPELSAVVRCAVPGLSGRCGGEPREPVRIGGSMPRLDRRWMAKGAFMSEAHKIAWNVWRRGMNGKLRAAQPGSSRDRIYRSDGLLLVWTGPASVGSLDAVCEVARQAIKASK